MKKMFMVFALAAVTLSIPINSSAWNKRNHAAIAIIAENHLTPEAKAKVHEIIGGPMATYSSYLDQYRKQMTGIQHTFKADKEFKGMTAPLLNKKGDKNALVHIEDCIKNLKHYKDFDDSTRRVDMYSLIHLIGDIHCPSHVSFEDNRNKACTKVVFQNKEMKFHTIWDDKVMTQFDGGPLDVAYICDTASEEEIAKIQSGTLSDWTQDIANRCKDIHCLEQNAEIGYEYIRANWPLAKEETMRAGYRLAKVMNDLFSK